MLEIDTAVTLAGVTLKNPVVVASGTFGFGEEYGKYYDLDELGGICVKGLTLHQREGNPPPRIAETPMGILNSVGLQNPGVDAFIRRELPRLRQHDVKVIANISGNTPEEYGVMCEKLSDAGVDLIELNISCPNVKAGGLQYGVVPEMAAQVTREAKAHARMPVMVKLSPNVTDITVIARAVEDAGAHDAMIFYYGSKLRVGQVSGMKIYALTIGMAGQDGPFCAFHHIPESRFGQMGDVCQHVKPLHLGNERPPLPGKAPARLVAVAAGEEICVVPGGMHHPDAPPPSAAQCVDAAPQQFGPLHREKGREFPTLKCGIRLRPGAAEGDAARFPAAGAQEGLILRIHCFPGAGLRTVAEQGEDLRPRGRPVKAVQIPLSVPARKAIAPLPPQAADGVTVCVKQRQCHVHHQNAFSR